MKRKQARRKKRRMQALVLVLFLIVLAGAVFFVYYQTQYSLTLIGEDELEVNLCQVFEDPGVTAKKAGEDVQDEVEVYSTLNTEVPGRYVIEYRMGEKTVERYVTVTSTMDPRLELEGGDSMDIRLGEAFEEPGYSASGRGGSDLTSRVKVNMPELKKTGKSEIVYMVTDDEGKSTRVVRRVHVMPNTEYETPGLAVCMYHYVYNRDNPPDDLYRRFGNYIEAGDLEEELRWLKSEGYYFPTWQEVRDYAEGRLLLPEKSIVLCFDDGAKSFLKNGIPVLEECRVPATCFMITSESGQEKVADYQSRYVTYQSHSHNMHRNGGSVGHGGIFTALAASEALDDLRQSIEICKSSDAFAYPYGDYTQECRDIVSDAGFLCAVTTEPGKVRPGMDPLLLPRVRMSMGQSLEQFQHLVAP